MQAVHTIRRSGQLGDSARALPLGRAVMGSIFVLVLISKAPLIQQGLRRWLPRTRAFVSRGPHLATLRAAILGQEKNRVTEMMGPPTAQTGGRFATWYYPVKATDRLTMAVSFDAENVKNVEFFHPPQNRGESDIIQ